MPGLEKREFYWLKGDKILRVDDFDSESDGHKTYIYVVGEILGPRSGTLEFHEAEYGRTANRLSRPEPVTGDEKEKLKKRFEKLGSLDIFEKFFSGK